MLRTFILLISLVAAAALGWFFLQPDQPTGSASKAPVAHTPAVNPTPARHAIIDHQGKPIPATAQAEAITHIDNITPPEQMPLNIRKAQHFVTADQLLQLPLKHIQSHAALESALSATPPATNDKSSTADPVSTPSANANPVTVETLNHTEPSPAEEAGTPITTPAPMNLITITQGSPSPAVTVMTPKTVTVRAVNDAGLTVTPMTKNISGQTRPTQPETPEQRVLAQAQATLLPSDGQQIKLKELLDHPENSANKIFYLHAVHQNDDQGMWGIIQAALVNSFAEGITLPGKTAAQALIPSDADERLRDRRSSFLGHILQKKVQESYIYNYDKGMLGRNPDLIQPGQQLVIITFTEDELVQIYQFFASP